MGEPCEFCGCPHPELAKTYEEAIGFLFGEYRYFSEQMFQYLAERTPRPADMKPDAYERTLRARAFDIARYILPLATNTSLGQITMRQLKPAVPILLLSACLSLPEETLRLVDAYVTKGQSPCILLEHLDSLLHKGLKQHSPVAGEA